MSKSQSQVDIVVATDNLPSRLTQAKKYLLVALTILFKGGITLSFKGMVEKPDQEEDDEDFIFDDEMPAPVQ